MPSYNLPHYGPIPSSSPPRHRPPPLNFSHSPPSPSPPPAPLSPPASVKQRFTSQWTPRRHYCRSPLALSVLTPHLIKNIRRQHWEHHPALSRRYLRPPPLSACAAVQAFQRPPFSYTMTEGRDPREIQEVEDRLFEEMVSRTIERRLGEKVARTKMAGERAGLGVAAGREMMLWSALGRVRESRRKAALATAPMSAPPGRQFFFPTPPTARCREESNHRDAEVARRIGHRKAFSTPTPAPSLPPRSVTPSPTSEPVATTLGKIRGFVERRANSASPMRQSMSALDWDDRENRRRLREEAALGERKWDQRGIERYSDEEEEDEDVPKVIKIQLVAPPSPTTTELRHERAPLAERQDPTKPLPPVFDVKLSTWTEKPLPPVDEKFSHPIAQVERPSSPSRPQRRPPLFPSSSYPRYAPFADYAANLPLPASPPPPTPALPTQPPRAFLGRMPSYPPLPAYSTSKYRSTASPPPYQPQPRERYLPPLEGIAPSATVPRQKPVRAVRLPTAAVTSSSALFSKDRSMVGDSARVVLRGAPARKVKRLNTV